MNNVLQLKGQFQKRVYSGTFGPPNLPKGAIVTTHHIEELRKQLQSILAYWVENQIKIGGALVSVHYRHVVAKSNRLKILLGEGSKSPNESIRGSKFVWEPGIHGGETIQKHVFTHFINLKAIKDSIERLDASARIVRVEYGGQITDKDTEQINNGNYSNSSISKTIFLKAIVDAHFVEEFDIDKDTKKLKKNLSLPYIKLELEH